MICESLYEITITPSNDIFENIPPYLKAQIAKYVEETVDKKIKEIVEKEVEKAMSKYKYEDKIIL